MALVKVTIAVPSNATPRQIESEVARVREQLMLLTDNAKRSAR